MINILKKLSFPSLLLLIFIYPILPSFGYINTDIISLITVLLSFFMLINFNFNISYTFKYLKENSLLISLIALNLCMYISSIFSTDILSTLGSSFQFTLYIVIFFIISYVYTKKSQSRYIVLSLLISFITVNVFSLFQLLKKLHLNQQINRINRLTSTLDNSNLLGAYSVMIIFVFITFFLFNRSKRLKIFNLIIILLSLVSIVGSQSRNALIGLIFGLVLLNLILRKKLIKYLLITLPLLILIIPKTRNLLFQVFDFSQNSSRIKIWITSLYIIRDNLFTGIGYENFNYIYSEYIIKYPDLLVTEGLVVFHPHNAPLKFLCELGIFGFAFFLVFLFVSINVILKLTKIDKDNYTKQIIIGLSIGYLSFIIMNLLDSFFSSPKILLTMFIILGLLNSYMLRENYQ